MSSRSRLFLTGVVALFTACGGRALTSSDEPGCVLACEPSPAAGGAPLAEAGRAGELPAAKGGSGASDEAAGAPSALGGAAGDDAVGSGGEEELGGAGAGGTCSAARFANGVLDYAFGGGQNHGQKALFPAAIFGPPVAGDPGSLVSLGNGGWVVVEFAGNAIVDGPGTDFTVFENPLGNFKELATVAVSDDAVSWFEFPCTAAQDAADYGDCAGVGAVHSSPKNGIDPLDPGVSGGDHYDLAELHLSHARYVRVTDRVDLTGLAGVFDLDSVAIINAECP